MHKVNDTNLQMRYIIPFMYGKNTMDCRNIMLSVSGTKDKSGGRWHEDTVWRGDHDVYDYVLETFEAGGGSRQTNTGIILRYETDHDVIRSLLYKPKGHVESYDFDVTDAGMYLFINGVGFFWYEIDTIGEGLTTEELIVFQHRFKELNYKSNLKHFTTSDAGEQFLMGDWIACILQLVIPDVRYYTPRRNVIYNATDPDSPVFVPDKALLYTYLAYDQTEAADGRYVAYHLTKGYKGSYSMPDDIESRMRFPFSNVICYACNEGVGYYARIEEKNRVFFEEGMCRRFMSDYFVMYMLALNVYYSLILFADRIDDELPADALAYMPQDMYDSSDPFAYDKDSLYVLERKVTRLTTEFNVFISKNVRVSVSQTEHHNDFYEYIVSVLRINESINNLRTGLSALNKVLNELVKAEISYSNNEELINWRKNGEYASLSRENRYLQEEMYKDELTGLYNQKAYLKLSKEIYDEARETKKFLFICSVDMNGLKHINDECGGHDEGDRALRGVAQLLRESALDGDYLFRKGGDEFVVLGLRDTADGEADRFSAAMEDAMVRINADSDLPYRISASYGPLLVDMKDCDESLEELFKRSDDMMYEMKIARDEYRR